MFKVSNKNTRTMLMTSFWCFIVNFEQVNFNWDLNDVNVLLNLFKVNFVFINFNSMLVH